MQKNKLVSPRQQKGFHFEQLAKKYLCDQGLTLVKQNFWCPCGEIDLILKDKDVLVFTEVRFRTKAHHGSALESIHYNKQQKIIKTAKLFLLKHGLTERVSCRFDVIGLSSTNNQIQYQWIKNAFQ